MKKFDQINVIPFIDIMLVLLAIVLMTATFIAQGKIKVNLPESTTAEQQSENTAKVHRITVTKAGQYYLDDEPISLHTLEENVRKWQKNQRIVLKIDSESQFNEFIKIGDVLRQSELNNVSIQSQIAQEAN